MNKATDINDCAPECAGCEDLQRQIDNLKKALKVQCVCSIGPCNTYICMAHEFLNKIEKLNDRR